MNNKTILLTGHSGFIGSNLKIRLEQLGYKVVLFSRHDHWLFIKEKIDVIINLAGETQKEDQMFDSNLVLVQSLLEYARLSNVDKFIQVGSSSEYGPTDDERVEYMICKPSNIYEATKSAATQLCIGYANRYDMDICIVRPFSIYGPNDKPYHFIPQLWRHFLDQESIDVYRGGHDWLYIDDFIDGLIILLESPKEKTKGDIINFGSEICKSNFCITNIFNSVLASLNLGYLKFNVKNEKYHTYDIDVWLANCGKAHNKYDWRPKINTHGGIRKYIDWAWFQEDKG